MVLRSSLITMFIKPIVLYLTPLPATLCEYRDFYKQGMNIIA